MIKSMKRNLFAGLVMVLGCSMVFTLLVVMNAQNRPEKRVEKSKTTAVVISPKKKKPKAKRRIAKRRARRSSSKARAPLPALGAALSGNSFGIPALSGADIADASASGLVSDRNLKDMVMTEDAVDVPPRPVMRTSPDYPPRARVKGVTGRVTLGLLIGPNGQVMKVRVLDATPPGVFDQAALDAVRNWRFEPARYRAQAVKVWARQTVHFNLS